MSENLLKSDVLNLLKSIKFFDLIRTSGIQIKPETLCHQASFSKI